MLRDLLQSLLIKNPSKRISDIDTIFKHPWIKSLGGEQYMHALQQKKVKPPFAPDPYRFNFDEEEFGQGEKQFLTEMRAIQDQQAENHPRDVTLPEFYYQLSKRFLEGTGGTDTLNEAERYQSVQMHPDRSEFQTGQLSQRSNNLRMNTLDDAFGIN
jgi:serum/glucocorticoid-regulated kinase 2